MTYTIAATALGAPDFVNPIRVENSVHRGSPPSLPRSASRATVDETVHRVAVTDDNVRARRPFREIHGTTRRSVGFPRTGAFALRPQPPDVRFKTLRRALTRASRDR